MDGGVDRAQFHHLGPGGGDETAIRGSARGGESGIYPRDFGNGGAGYVHQGAVGGQERIAGEAPGEVVVEPSLLQDGLDAALDAVRVKLGGEPQVELGLQLSGNNIDCARVRDEFRDLEAGGRKEGVASVPDLGNQLGEHRREKVQRIFGLLGIGDVSLLAMHDKPAADAAAPSVFDQVSQPVGAGWLPHQAVVDLLPPRFEPLHHLDGAVPGRAFFIAGDEKGDGAGGIRIGGEEGLGGGDHGRQGPLHITGAAAVEPAVTDHGVERVRCPLLQGAGRHHIRMAGEAEQGPRSAAAGPEIAHLAERQGFDLESHCREPLA